MRQKKLWFAMSGIFTALALALMLPPEALAANKFHVLYRFTLRNGGVSPSGLTLDAAGNSTALCQKAAPTRKAQFSS